MSGRGGRKSRGTRVPVLARIPVELFEAIEQDRSRVGASRLDYVWSVLAQHMEMSHLDPLKTDSGEQLGLTPEATRKAKPTRAA